MSAAEDIMKKPEFYQSLEYNETFLGSECA